MLRRGGFGKGRASPCCFYRPQKKIWVVHGDDFLTVGEEAGLDYLQRLLADEYDIKAARIGPEQGDARELKAFGRIIQYS